MWRAAAHFGAVTFLAIEVDGPSAGWWARPLGMCSVLDVEREWVGKDAIERRRSSPVLPKA